MADTSPPNEGIGDETDTPAQNYIRGRLIAIGAYLALSVGLFFILSPMMSDQGELQDQLRNAGSWGVLFFIVLYALQVFIPWLPGAPLDAIGGATFGLAETLLLTSLASTFCGLIVILVVQRVGLETLVSRFPGLLEAPWRLVRVIRHKPVSILAVNLLTGDVAYFVAGAARTPLLFTLVVFAVMRLPSVTIWASLGAGLISTTLGEQLNSVTIIGTVITVAGLLMGLTLANRYLPGWLERLETDAEKSEER